MGQKMGQKVQKMKSGPPTDWGQSGFALLLAAVGLCVLSWLPGSPFPKSPVLDKVVQVPTQKGRAMSGNYVSILSKDSK